MIKQRNRHHQQQQQPPTLRHMPRAANQQVHY
jgi:hypothetical protein